MIINERRIEDYECDFKYIDSVALMSKMRVEEMRLLFYIIN
ncbi:hypothetical protein MNSC_08050 [Minisyncoccus archaeophilus]|nr:MAG: hypothetical protein BWY21_01025 [Parcubacteria group bacterium ADurb.Bin216]